jgi:uncharacterized protein (DUF2147 family)
MNRANIMINAGCDLQARIYFVRGNMRIWVFFAIIMLTATTAIAANPGDVIGLWKTDGDRSVLEIYGCGEKLCGKVVWLKNPNYVSSKDGPVGTPKVDRKNPDPTLRRRPIIGLQVIEGLTATEDYQWEHGICYDPESGNSYQCKIHIKPPIRLEVRGFIGISLLGRTYVLTRKENPASAQAISKNP